MFYVRIDEEYLKTFKYVGISNPQYYGTMALRDVGYISDSAIQYGGHVWYPVNSMPAVHDRYGLRWIKATDKETEEIIGYLTSKDERLNTILDTKYLKIKKNYKHLKEGTQFSKEYLTITTKDYVIDIDGFIGIWLYIFCVLWITVLVALILRSFK